MLPTVSSQSAAAVGDSRRPADAGRSNPDPANAPAAGAFGAVLAEQTGAADSAASSRGGDGRPADDAAAPGATGGDADGNVRQARGKALPTLLDPTLAHRRYFAAGAAGDARKEFDVETSLLDFMADNTVEDVAGCPLTLPSSSSCPSPRPACL